MHPRAREDPGSSHTSRRQALRAAGTVGALGVVGTGGYLTYRLAVPATDPRTVISLYSQTVAYAANQSRVLVRTPESMSELLPGTRLHSGLPTSSPVLRRAHDFWEGTASWRSRVDEAQEGHEMRAVLRDLAGSALRDLWVLADDLPAPVAGWSTSWRYIWPRDAAFCAVALARVGHVDRAIGVLTHLQSIQAEDGWFEARYAPGTDRAPDGRDRQFDGTGLVLWALSEVARTVPDADRPQLLEDFAPLISTTRDALLRETQDGTEMPPVSPDYWEVRERAVTLGLMASALAGLRAVGELTGDDKDQEAARSFSAVLTDSFGAHGFQRYRRRGGSDSALAVLDATGCHGVASAQQLLDLRQELARPGGGIAPGASWREDGVSWTPSTSLLALALARAGEVDAALEILGWLAAHRTDAGSLPEKVLFDGRPAAVAPLAWTAANVLLTLDALAST
ncbi:MAG: hypothetical protein ACTIMA_08230 [Brachybacterium tyrofermentans]|uniref:Glycoside hydrolase family 15 n=1 Tax=Brachybacterium tyrofermentans TaxID=47848 RepID=A0ABW0FEV1_9MICO|nr:hypothetical protein [Brachybacterium tyrofermentans]SLN03676.1 Sensor histidine kinase [Corynebacterium xerosis]